MENSINSNKPLIHSFPDAAMKSSSYSYSKSIGVIFAFVIIGILAGFATRQVQQYISSSGKIINPIANKTNGVVRQRAGIVDKKTFKDDAEGILQEGGKDGEGIVHLERPGGESQNVYLTSDTVDLTEFIGQKVRVYGETFASEKVGWLMNVGYIEVMK